MLNAGISTTSYYVLNLTSHKIAKTPFSLTCVSVLCCSLLLTSLLVPMKKYHCCIMFVWYNMNCSSFEGYGLLIPNRHDKISVVCHTWHVLCLYTESLGCIIDVVVKDIRKINRHVHGASNTIAVMKASSQQNTPKGSCHQA